MDEMWTIKINNKTPRLMVWEVREYKQARSVVLSFFVLKCLSVLCRLPCLKSYESDPQPKIRGTAACVELQITFSWGRFKVTDKERETIDYNGQEQITILEQMVFFCSMLS